MQPDIHARPTVPLDAPENSMVELIKELHELVASRKQIEVAEKEIRNLLKEKIPVGHVGTIGGRPAWAHTPQDGKLATDKFRKAMPEMYEEFSEYLAELKLNIERLRRERPDIYEQFQVSTLAAVGPQ